MLILIMLNISQGHHHHHHNQDTMTQSPLTVESDAVEILRPCDLRGHLHTPADEGLSEDVLHGPVVLGFVGQLVDHRNGVLHC